MSLHYMTCVLAASVSFGSFYCTITILLCLNTFKFIIIICVLIDDSIIYLNLKIVLF